MSKYKEYPRCPRCSSDILVEGSKSNVYYFVCWACDVRFGLRAGQDDIEA